MMDKELFSIWQGADVIHENINVGCRIQGSIKFIDIRKLDNTKLINYFDKNRVEVFNVFIDLKDKMKNEDVDTLERILHTLHTAKNYNIQNRFLNFWSSLEYSIYAFPRNSIIEKARTIIAESFTLFYIKNKMNIFWERLSYTIQKNNSPLENSIYSKMIEECKFESDYNTKKLIEYLQNKDIHKELISRISFNIVLTRELKELIMLVTDIKKTKDAIEDYYESIVHDLDCIYRLRNQLIHSAKSVDESLEDISLRLYRYVNSTISSILYYKKKNAEISITEILNSIHNTYENLMKKLCELEKIKSYCPSVDDCYLLVRPKYLFIE